MALVHDGKTRMENWKYMVHPVVTIAKVMLCCRAQTRTSRTVCITQGDILDAREIPTSSRMQWDTTESTCPHILNQWRKRTNLVLIHASMFKEDKPDTMRVILKNGLRALMTRFYPSTGKSPQKTTIEFTITEVGDISMYDSSLGHTCSTNFLNFDLQQFWQKLTQGWSCFTELYLICLYISHILH